MFLPDSPVKAIVFNKYGGPEALKLQEVATPDPAPDEVRIKVVATSVNDWDLGIITGTPYLMRLSYGIFKPRPRFQIVGCDVAGIVDAVGRDVASFNIGDAVYGDLHASGFGAYAEFTCAKAIHLIKKPARLSFEEAAAVPHGATLAWQGLREAKIEAGQKVLINGAGGGVGPIAIQLLKHKGVEVTAVDSAGKLDMLKALGCDRVIDYTEQDFAKSGEQYDLVYDTRTSYFPFHYLAALKPQGRYVTIGGASAQVTGLAMLSGLINRVSGKTFKLIILQPVQGLAEMAGLIEDGVISPIIDGPFDLAQAAQAMDYYRGGQQKGRIVIKVSSP